MFLHGAGVIIPDIGIRGPHYSGIRTIVLIATIALIFMVIFADQVFIVIIMLTIIMAKGDQLLLQ